MIFSQAAGHTVPEIQTVTAWHEALNSGDVERLIGLSHPDVEVGGPRGAGRGTELLRDWVDRANVHLKPARIFHEAHKVVVEQEAEWHSAETGEPNDAQTVASVFLVHDGLVASVMRYPDVAEALRAANLDGSREGRPGRLMANREDQPLHRSNRETLTTEPLHVRRYEQGDKCAVRRLHDDALNEVGAHLGSGPWDEDLDRIEDIYLRSGGEFLVGTVDGEIVAMGALRRISPGKAGVTRMRVRPALQGRGYGQILLDALHHRAAELGYRALHLDTTVQQRAAQLLYVKNGYTEVGRGRIGPFECIFYERGIVA
jgi:ribosomal protein S18 acetylase RimI-like enzyme